MAVNITNNLNLWDKNLSNYTTSANLALDTQCTGGFQSNDYLKSSIFNGILMEATLVTKSLIDALAEVTSSATGTYTISNATSPSDLKTVIKNILSGLSVNYATSCGSTTSAGKATNISGGAIGSIPYQSAENTTTFLAKGTSGQILSQGSSNAPVWINPSTLSVASATSAATAAVATNVGDITNDDTGANTTIAFSIGTGANKKSFSKTITVQVPGTVSIAETVTDNIKIDGTNKSIASIFETNGDAKKATYATSAGTAASATTATSATTAQTAGYATSAGSATSATSATTATTYLQVHNNSMAINDIFAADGSAVSAVHADAADTATNADYATSAGTATSATNADYATSAGTANSADTAYSCTEASVASQAETTDFTNSNWTIKDIGIYDTLIKGGTYEIQVNTSSTYANEWHNFPLITIATGNSGGNHSVCWMTGTAYTEFTYDVSLNSGGVINSPSWATSTKWRYRRIR